MIGVAPALLVAQGPASAVVAGRVVTRPDSGAVTAVTGATVSISGDVSRSITDSGGWFVLPGVSAGAHTLTVRQRGFRDATRAIYATAGDTIRIEIVLEREPHRLAPVQTVGRSPDAETFATKPAVGTISMTAAAIAGVPAAGEPDVVRVTQLLPGVVARNDFNTGLNVRGGEADQNLILLDGYPLYNPFHLGGLASTFMDATVGGIELMTAAFPARFGGRLSSVLDVHSAEEARPGVHGSADISALGATAPFAGTADDGRATWSIAGRRT